MDERLTGNFELRTRFKIATDLLLTTQTLCFSLETQNGCREKINHARRCTPWCFGF